MTVSIETSENTYNGTGTTAPYAYAFKIFEDSDLYVFVTSADGIITPLFLNVGYTVTGAGDVGGGNVTLSDGSLCPVGAGITIQRRLPMVQEIADYTEGQAVSPESMEDALDYLTMLLQDKARELSERDDRITTLEATIAGIEAGVPSLIYIIPAAEGPISLPDSGSVLCGKSISDTSATVLDIVPSVASQTIEGLPQYRDGLSGPGECVYLVFNSAGNNWYKFGG